MIASLLFPFLRFCCDNDERIPHEGAEYESLCMVVIDMFTNNILVRDSLKKIDDADFMTLARLYIDLQATLLKRQKNALKALFVEQAIKHDLFSSSLLASALTEITLKVKNDDMPMEDLDFFLETALQIAKPSEKLN